MNWKFWERKDGRRDDAERFDFYSVGGVSDATVAAYFAATNEEARKMPLLVAAHVQSKIEEQLASGTALGDDELREARGGLRALHMFARLLTGGVKEWQSRNDTHSINFTPEGGEE